MRKKATKYRKVVNLLGFDPFFRFEIESKRFRFRRKTKSYSKHIILTFTVLVSSFCAQAKRYKLSKPLYNLTTCIMSPRCKSGQIFIEKYFEKCFMFLQWWGFFWNERWLPTNIFSFANWMHPKTWFSRFFHISSFELFKTTNHISDFSIFLCNGSSALITSFL